MITDFYRRLILRRLLKKPSPDRYTMSLPENEQKNYDFISVLGSTNEHEDAYILAWDERGDVVSYMWWAEGAANVPGTETTCKFTDLKWDSLNVRHRYRTWDIRYSNAFEAYWHDILHLPILKWWLQKLRNKFLRPVSPDYRMDLLKQIIDLHSRQLPITTIDLLVNIHGSAIRLSSDFFQHQQNLQFLLDSLKDSGDVLLRGENNAMQFLGDSRIVPTPKSAATIATLNEDVRRHQDVVKLSKRQLWLGWAMFAIAAVTLIVEVRKWLE